MVLARWPLLLLLLLVSLYVYMFVQGTDTRRESVAIAADS